jgi:hypothetical protein
MVRHFLSISITSGAIAVAIAAIDMPLSLTMLDDLLRLSITLTINNDKIARFHLSPPLRVTPPRSSPAVVGRNKPPGPAFRRPDDKLSALRRSGLPHLLPPSIPA